MNANYFQRVSATTPTTLWINNVTREEAQLAIESGAIGCTQNPSFPWKMLCDPVDGPYAKQLLDDILLKEEDDDRALAQLQCELVKNICQYFLPMFVSSGGKQGWVSIQGDPFKEDVASILEFARYHRQAAPNVIAKIPVTKDGLEAMRILVREHVPVLATEVMAVDQALDVCDLYSEETARMENPPAMYLAHIAGIFDEHLQITVEKEAIEVSRDALWQAGIAAAKKIYELMLYKRSDVKFLSGGARGLQHFTEMVGANSSVTINWKNTADKLIETDPPVVQRFLTHTPYNVIDELLAKVEDFRKAYIPKSLKQEDYEHFGPVVLFRNAFESAWINCKNYIEKRRKEL